MHCREHPLWRWHAEAARGKGVRPVLQRSACLADAELRAVEGLACGASEQDHADGPHELELGYQPWSTCGDVYRARRLVDALLSAGAGPPEVLDDVGAVD